MIDNLSIFTSLYTLFNQKNFVYITKKNPLFINIVDKKVTFEN